MSALTLCKRKAVLGTFPILAGFLLLVGCDVYKGTEIAKVQVGQVGVIATSIELPLGQTDFRFVPRDHGCKQQLGASMLVVVKLANGVVLEEYVNLDELTWPETTHGCWPIGYLQLNDGSRPLRFTIDGDSNPVEFRLAVTQAAGVEREVGVWVVYNDRDPVSRMLGGRRLGTP